MKKLLSIVLALGLVLGFSACAAAGSGTGETTGESMTLDEIMDAILDGVENLPESESVELSGDKWATYAFIAPPDGAEGLASEALMSPSAHSVVLVRVPEGADAVQVASDMEANANPNKWICVSAEKTIVSRHGNTIMLLMSYEELADAISENFDNLFN